MTNADYIVFWMVALFVAFCVEKALWALRLAFSPDDHVFGPDDGEAGFGQ